MSVIVVPAIRPARVQKIPGPAGGSGVLAANTEAQFAARTPLPQYLTVDRSPPPLQLLILHPQQHLQTAAALAEQVLLLLALGVAQGTAVPQLQALVEHFQV